MIVTTDSVINRAKMRLRLMDNTEPDVDLERYIQEAARQLKTIMTFVVSCETVPIDCGAAKLPDQYYDLLWFSFPCGSGSCSGCCGAATTLPTPPSENQVVVCSCRGLYGFYQQNDIILQHGSWGWYGNYFKINGNYLTFPSTITQTEITIYYKGFNVDKDGLMIIDIEAVRALSAYAAYQYADSTPEAYTPFQINRWNNEWINQMNMLNGRSEIKKYKLDKPQISLIANAVLSNKRYSGIYPCSMTC